MKVHRVYPLLTKLEYNDGIIPKNTQVYQYELATGKIVTSSWSRVIELYKPGKEHLLKPIYHLNEHLSDQIKLMHDICSNEYTSRYSYIKYSEKLDDGVFLLAEPVSGTRFHFLFVGSTEDIVAYRMKLITDN